MLNTFLPQKLDSFVGLTIDTWTSSNKIAILAITVSWIDDAIQYRTVCIAFEVISGSHEAKNLGIIALRILEKYKLLPKVLCILSLIQTPIELSIVQIMSVTTDNAAVNGSMIGVFGILAAGKLPSFFSKDTAWKRCLVHTIQLACREGIAILEQELGDGEESVIGKVTLLLILEDEAKIE